jgi:hypothetical protein
VKHTAIENAIINDAIMCKRDLFVLSLDLRDAFDSVHHDMIAFNMEKIVIANPLRYVKMTT